MPTASETGGGNGEAVDNWQQIVRTLWMLNRISVGFKGVFPRLHRMPPSLEDLAQIIPSIRTKAAAEVLEGELKEMMRRFAQVIEPLTLGQDRMDALLRQLEEHRTEGGLR